MHQSNLHLINKMKWKSIVSEILNQINIFFKNDIHNK